MNKILYGACLGSMIGTVLIFAITFMIAYASPDKEVLVMINHYGEAHVELVLLLFVVGFAVPYVLYNSKRGMKIVEEKK